MSLVRRLVPPLVSGILFGAGLAIGGMTDPARVRGFLDVFGRWDPTLGFVMGGALAVMAIAWRVRSRMARPAFAERFSISDRKDLDFPLIGGAALFGVGWGVAGLCPGPAVASLSMAPAMAVPFVTAMIAGMTIHRLTLGRPR